MLHHNSMTAINQIHGNDGRGKDEGNSKNIQKKL